MAGPNFDIILGLSDAADKVGVSRKVFRVAATHGLGIIFGTIVIRRLYEAEGQMLDDLSTEVKNPLVFTVTSNPMATDALELFEQQLNPSTGTDPHHAGVLKFLDDMHALREIQEYIVVIWDGMAPSGQFMRREEMDHNHFRTWLMNYYKKEMTEPPYGGQGIFRIGKQAYGRKRPEFKGAEVKQRLEGLRVLITIDEDGTTNPPSLPAGTIIRKLTGTDGANYYLVRLDKSVKGLRGNTGEEWTLLNLAVTNHFEGLSVEELPQRKGGVPVRIVNPLVSLAPDDPLLDLSKAVYFALGTVRVA